MKNRIYNHCTAGFGNVQAIDRFWIEELGWINPGYCIIIELDGTRWYLHKMKGYNRYKKEYSEFGFLQTTNGIKGFNKNGIHIATIGGVRNTGTKQKPIWIAEDTRTQEQIKSLHEAHKEIIDFLVRKGQDVTKNFGVYGHRDCSPDQNGDGVISKWERIKECPSWDVMESEFHSMYSSKDRLCKLPYED